jgi:hypothetical protein
MKRLLKIGVIFLILVPNFLHAQTGKLEIGLEGGPNVAFFRVRNNPALKHNPTIYGLGGFAFQINFSKLIALRSVISYEVKGYQTPLQIIANGQDLGTSTIHSQFNYLTLPILMRLNFGERIKFFVNAGPYFGYLLSKEDRITKYEEYSGDAMNSSVKGYERFDMGISAGFGIGIPFKEHWTLSLEARNNLGLIPLKSAKTDNAIFTNSSNLLLGVSYRLKPRESKKKKDLLIQDNRLTIGIQSGINATSIREGKKANYTSTSPRYGYSTGLTFAWNSSKHFSFQTGISFDHKVYAWQTRTSNDFPVTGTNTKSISSYDYLTVPVLSRFTFGKKVNFFFNAGVYIGFLVKQSDDLEIDHYSSSGFNSYHTNEKGKVNNIKNYNTLDFGLAGGIGIGIPIKKHWNISLEARDHLGVVNTNKPLEIKLNTMNLLIGISYKLSFRESSN